MRHTFWIALFLAFLTLLSTPSAMAGTVGIIEGKVIDRATGDGLPGANVLLAGTRLGASTGADGSFVIVNVPAGTYDIVTTLIGYRGLRMRGARVVADLRSKVEVRLEQSTVELGEIEVTAEAPPILRDVTGTVHTIGSKQIEELPVTSFLGVVALQPGVTADLHIRGGKVSESLYLVDGIPVQDLIGGGVGADLPRSSIVSMNVETGGYEAEYGNALSGVVNMVTASGTNEHAFVVRGESDQLFGGEEVDHRTQGELSGGGPIVRDHLFYFFSGSVVASDTRYWQDFQLFFDSPITTQYTGFAKLTYQPSPSFRLGAQILGSTFDSREYLYSWRFNLDGLPPQTQSGYRAALIASHTLSPSLFYTASLSHFIGKSHIGGDDASGIDTTMYQYDFFLQYIIDGARAWWGDQDQHITTLKADVTYHLSNQHHVQAGGEFNYYAIASDVMKYEPQTNVWGKPFVNKPLLNYSAQYNYYPYSASAYASDKIQLTPEGMLLSVGVRWDYLNPRAERPAVERIPVSDEEYETVITGYVPASPKSLWSPRVGFSAPFAARGYLFVNYGHYVQFPLFDYLYSGLSSANLANGVGVLIGNPDLRPEETTAWEFSAKYAFESDIVLSLTYFDKTTYNQIDVKTFIPTTARAAGDFGYAEFVNNPFARVQGFEAMISRDGDPVLNGSVSYTLMAAEGLSEDSRQGLTYYQWGFAPPPKLYPLSWDQRHTVKLIASAHLPWTIDFSAVWTYASGRPYTYYPTLDGFTPLDSTQRFVPNNARMESVSELDVKVSKRWDISDALSLLFYIDARNVFDQKNVRWVDSGGKVGGELGDITAWGYPRRVRIGLQLNL